MRSSYRIPRPLLLVLGLLVLLVIARPRQVSATEPTCYDQYGMPRQCTATELYGACLDASADSYEQCVDGAPWYKEGGCILAKTADDLACTVDFVWGTVLPPL